MALSCRKASQLVHLHVSNALSAREADELKTHIERCQPCQRALEEAQFIAECLRSAAPTPPAPVGLAASIKARARMEEAHRRANAVPARAIGSPAFLAVCSSLLVGAVITFVTLTQVVIPSYVVDDDQPAAPPAASLAAAVTDGTIPLPVVRPSLRTVRTISVATSQSTRLRVRDIPPHFVTSAPALVTATQALGARSRADRTWAARRAASSAHLGVDTSAISLAVTEARTPEITFTSRNTQRTSDGEAGPSVSTAALTGTSGPDMVGALVAGLVVDRFVRDELAGANAAISSPAAPTPAAHQHVHSSDRPTKDQ
jgi:hypothetical protein